MYTYTINTSIHKLFDQSLAHHMIVYHYHWFHMFNKIILVKTLKEHYKHLHLESSEDTDPADVATFIPVVARKMTEKETIRKSVHHRQPTEDQIVPWPENGSVPIDEFKTEGYISCAFPTLFPTGEADFIATRLQSVTVGMYFRHLMKAGLRSTLASDTLLSTLRCAGVLSRLAGFTSTSTQTMPASR